MDENEELMRERIETAVRRAEAARVETKALVRDIVKIQRAHSTESIRRRSADRELTEAKFELMRARAELPVVMAEVAWLRGRDEATNLFLAAFVAGGGCGKASCRDKDQKPGDGSCAVCAAFRAVRDFKVVAGDE